MTSASVNGVTWNYSWNAENKLIRAASSMGKDVLYSYFEDGNLASKTADETTNYIYDGIHCIAEYNGSNSLIEEVVYGPNIDEVLCVINDQDTARYFHQDALQSVVAVTDGFRNKVASYEYDVYGEIRKRTGSYENEILYTGRWLDSETGLYYYRARWYDANAGRFISRDPIGVDGGINLYGYCGNNVTNNTDPKGLEYGVDTGWGWELGLFVSVGTFELTCCDDKCKKHLARYKKKCYGLYAGGSVGGGAVTGLSGASCPRGYEGWFSEGSPIPTPGAGADFAYSDDIARGPHYAGAGLGWSWGVRRCYYTLISDQIIGECK